MTYLNIKPDAPRSSISARSYLWAYRLSLETSSSNTTIVEIRTDTAYTGRRKDGRTIPGWPTGLNKTLRIAHRKPIYTTLNPHAFFYPPPIIRAAISHYNSIHTVRDSLYNTFLVRKTLLIQLAAIERYARNGTCPHTRTRYQFLTYAETKYTHPSQSVNADLHPSKPH